MSLIRVLIVDDESLVRRALSLFLENEDDIRVIGTADNGETALAMAQTHKPDVIMMDLQMPRLTGVEATRKILQHNPAARIIAITTFGTTKTILEALRAGVCGYILKDTDPEDIINAVREVHSGTNVLSPNVTKALLNTLKQDTAHQPTPLRQEEKLTPREAEILACLASGQSNAEIAATLYVSESTVKMNLRSIMSKWQVRDRVQVLIKGVKTGLIQL